MSTENKYYTPSIEDMRVGYEYEQYHPRFYTNNEGELENRSVWHKDIISEPLMYGDTLSSKIKDKTIRTLYLTKEQIQTEGWVEIEAPITAAGIYFKHVPFGKKDYRLDYNYEMKLMQIQHNSYKDVYYGGCKTINEFRTIIKLLNIN